MQSKTKLRVLTHTFHVLDSSPWPLYTSFSVLSLAIGGVLYFHMYFLYTEIVPLSLFFLTFSVGSWFLDIVNEATFGGFHTEAVQLGLKLGFILFLISEIMFFFGFFWAYFHSALNPSVFIGNIWPPRGIEVLSPYTIALLNTLLLLTSGATVTWAHYGILSGNRYEALLGLGVTIALGLIFTFVQTIEYKTASVSINDSVYGTLLYVMTGFHGLHVVIGTIFLAVCFLRLSLYHFTKEHHLGFEFAAWYWHFVDIVWIFLYICVYWWGWPSE